MSSANKIYLDFYQIDKSSYYEKVRYFEQNKNFLSLLAFDQKIEMECDYLFALFEIGKYHRFLGRVDRMIELVVIENIFELDNRNIFEDLLFTKAACLFNTNQYNKALNVTAALIKINHDYPLITKIHRQCLRKSGATWYEINKAIAVVFILSGISVVLVQLLIVDPFYEQYAYRVNIFRNILFAIAFSLLIFNEIKVRYITYNINK
jgi:tetratricopeptide (TPR) repeat protein